MYMDDILDWADMKFGESGDCEDEVNPKSNRSTYNKFPPKHTDKTRYGEFLKNFMEMSDLSYNNFTPDYNIYNYIFDNLNLRTVEKLFHSLSLEDQTLFIENIPTLQFDLRRYFDNESQRLDQDLNTVDCNSSDEEEEEEEEENEENLQEWERNNYHNNVINFIGNTKFEEMMSYCEDINNETKTVNDLISFIQREFSDQLENYWDDIVICCESIRFGKLDEAYVSELIEHPDTPVCSWDQEEENSESESESEEEELSDNDYISDDDDMPELLSPSENSS